MDIVYLVKKNKDNIELRFSLRSLKNIKHHRVFIIGYKPKWLQGVIHIPFDDNLGKYDNVKEKHKIILKNRKISENFIYMNDDFYFLENQEVEIYKMGTLENQIQYLQEKGYESKYVNKIKGVYNIFPNGISYETHTPFIYNKRNLRKLYKKYDTIFSLKSLYGNEYGIKSKDIISKNYIGSDLIQDCKCYNVSDIGVIEKQKIFSSDDSIIGDEFKDFMLGYFPNMSKYEIYDIDGDLVDGTANYNITISGVEYRKGYRYKISPDINENNIFGNQKYFTII